MRRRRSLASTTPAPHLPPSSLAQTSRTASATAINSSGPPQPGSLAVVPTKPRQAALRLASLLSTALLRQLPAQTLRYLTTHTLAKRAPRPSLLQDPSVSALQRRARNSQYSAVMAI